MGFAEYLGKDINLVEIKNDNTGSLALIKNPHLYERFKYIDIYYYYTRDLAKQGKIRLKYISINNIIADGFTKPLKRILFQKFVE